MKALLMHPASQGAWAALCFLGRMTDVFLQTFYHNDFVCLE